MLKSYSQILLNLLLRITALLSIGVGFLWQYPFELLSHGRVYYFLVSLLITIGILCAWFAGIRWQGTLCFALALLAFNSVWILPWYLPNSHQGRGEALRIIEFNINIQNTQLTSVANLVEQQKPDIAVLIEISPPAMKELTGHLQYTLPFAYRAPGGGLAVFSRFGLVNPQGKTLSAGTILTTSIKTGTKNITLVAAHPSVPIKPDLFAKRNTALAEVTQYLQTQKDKKLIFAGDLNLTPWSPYYKRLVEKTGLHNTKLGFGVEPSWIEPTTYVQLPALIISVIKLPIDHIFVSNDIKVLDCKTIKGGNSDHRMLLSDLAI
ncbi:endonuclease/exonuclease/phosphatase family protein [Nostoc sp. UCD121]|nr:endonuclease/exonuclease/phosphatase family protein [Nostoc sp. UCD120]MBC1278616.1 endonuclease/exonuclease/phosphatase family protein [Nostoc sp. UCD121]MBC1298992.1 endonuclease/exonuclease/phosphatase family protein [Nostoc sp. UCD122]